MKFVVGSEKFSMSESLIKKSYYWRPSLALQPVCIGGQGEFQHGECFQPQTLKFSYVHIHDIVG